MGRVNKLWAVLSVMIVLVGCGGKGIDPGTANIVPPVPTNAPTDALGVMPPIDALAYVPDRESSEIVLERQGKQYVPGLAQRVEDTGTSARFLPQWTDNSSGIDGLAYAIYRFNVMGSTGFQTLDLDWGEEPVDWGNVWVGFSHWGINGWKWKPCPVGGFVNLGSSGYFEYSQPGTGDVLIAVVLLGTDPAQLDLLTIGESAQGDWWMLGRNPDHTATSPFVGAQANQVKWIFTVDEEFNSPAAFDADGTAYVGNSNGKLYAINPDGTEKWSFATGGKVQGSPAVGVDGTIYVGSQDNKLYALSPGGSLKWSYETQSTLRHSPALAVDGTVYLGCGGFELLAINPDGSLQWSFSFINEHDGLETTLTSMRGSPAIGADGTIYLGSAQEYLFAINPDGSLKWSYWLGIEERFETAPVLGADGTIYIRDYRGELMAFTPDGSLKWEAGLRHEIQGYRRFHGPAIGPDGTLYVDYFSELYAINPEDGSIVASYNTNGPRFTRDLAVGKDGLVYAVSSVLFAFNPDLSINWYHQFTTGGTGFDYCGPVIGSDGTLFLGSIMFGPLE